MELAIKDASGGLEVSEATFGREFNDNVTADSARYCTFN